MNGEHELNRRDRILGGLWGSLVGDALGAPVEFSGACSRKPAEKHSPFVRSLKENGHISVAVCSCPEPTLFRSIKIVFCCVGDSRYFSHKRAAVTRRDPTDCVYTLDIRDV